MPEHDCADQQLHGARQLVGESRLSVHHLLADASQSRDPGAHPPLWVDQLLILGNHPPPLDAHDAQFDHPMTELGRRTGSLHVEKREGRVVEGLKE